MQIDSFTLCVIVEVFSKYSLTLMCAFIVSLWWCSDSRRLTFALIVISGALVHAAASSLYMQKPPGDRFPCQLINPWDECGFHRDRKVSWSNVAVLIGRSLWLALGWELADWLVSCCKAQMTNYWPREIASCSSALKTGHNHPTQFISCL